MSGGFELSADLRTTAIAQDFLISEDLLCLEKP